MTAGRLIRSALAEHIKWWNALGDAIESADGSTIAVTGCASASSVGMAVALAWVAREYPDRADELAAVVRNYVDNGGDDDDLFTSYSGEAVAS